MLNVDYYQNLLDDLYMLGANSARITPQLEENKGFLSLTNQEQIAYINELVKNGANPTNVFTKSLYIGTFEEIENFIKLGADINKKGLEHYPITRACSKKKVKVIDLLLKNNVDLNVKFRNLTPHMISYLKSDFKTIEKLEKNQLIKDSFSLHHFLNDQSFDFIPTHFSDKNIVHLFEFFISKGYDLFKLDENGKNCFHYFNPLSFSILNNNQKAISYFKNLGFSDEYILHDLSKISISPKLMNNFIAIASEKINQGYDLLKLDKNNEMFFDNHRFLKSLHLDKTLFNVAINIGLIALTEKNKKDLIFHQIFLEHDSHNLHEKEGLKELSIFLAENGYDFNQKHPTIKKNMYQIIKKANNYQSNQPVLDFLEELKIICDKYKLSQAFKPSNKVKIFKI